MENENEKDYFEKLFNGLFINEFMEIAKKEFKANKTKTHAFSVIRRQLQIGNKINESYIKNKQNFTNNIKSEFGKLAKKDLIKFIQSPTINKLHSKEIPDLIIDVTGLIMIENNKTENMNLNINYTFFWHDSLLEFINFDFKELLKITSIPYNDEFFLINHNNSFRYLSSIIGAYSHTFPEQMQDMYDEFKYDLPLKLLPKVLDLMKNKANYLLTDELKISFMENLFNNYINYDPKIIAYCKPYTMNPN